MFIDILKAIAIAAVIIVGVQLLPIGQAAATITTIIVFGMTLWGVALVVKLFTSFTGHSIRYIMNDEGVTAMADEGELGLSYVAKQVSTMKWDPMHAGSMRAANIKPNKQRIAWNKVSGYQTDPDQKVVILNKGTFGNMRLFCSENNFETVVKRVESHCHSPKPEII
ncbi:MAG: hypothetical protein NWF07_14380 [Candidatus Bathyarchaeota archaeon]|nr:hypothetical protein [Candidatus Bathyarchaeota archaeon]